MKWEMRITGAADLARNLRALPEAVSKKVVRSALKNAGGPMRDRMKGLAPRGPEAPHMADSITIGNARADTPTAVSIIIGPTRDFFYARFVEWGTKHMPARPFMRTGFDQAAGESLQRLQTELWTAIARQAASGAK